MSEDQAIPEPGAKNTEIQNDADGELKAINGIVEALKPLNERERQRALEYVLGRFGAPPPKPPAPLSNPQADAPVQMPQQTTGYIQDIRSLKETKAPKSANEMAALVAYYVSELAPAAERSKQVGKADIERYFKMAGFRLPADAGFTLVNAKNAGYLDTAGGGQYTLNPVGYNLVVHRMGLEKSERKGAHLTAKPTRKSSKKAALRGKK